jgi:predicted amino acid-binding ACT domain protein
MNKILRKLNKNIKIKLLQVSQCIIKKLFSIAMRKAHQKNRFDNIQAQKSTNIKLLKNY